MADTRVTPTTVESHEQSTVSPETGLRRLGKEVGGKVQRTTGTILAGLALAVSSPALAADTPVTPSTSANASADKVVGQKVVLKDGRMMSFVEIGKLQGKEKDTMIDGMSRSEKIKFKEWELEVANQTEKKIDTNIQVANQTEKKIDTALSQMNAFYELLDQLFTEQGVQVSENKEYKSQAIIARRVLDNPVLTSKLTPDAISFLKNIEQSLSQGKNPFAYMSREGKAKLRAIFKV